MQITICPSTHSPLEQTTFLLLDLHICTIWSRVWPLDVNLELIVLFLFLDSVLNMEFWRSTPGDITKSTAASPTCPRLVTGTPPIRCPSNPLRQPCFYPLPNRIKVQQSLLERETFRKHPELIMLFFWQSIEFSAYCVKLLHWDAG